MSFWPLRQLVRRKKEISDDFGMKVDPKIITDTNFRRLLMAHVKYC